MIRTHSTGADASEGQRLNAELQETFIDRHSAARRLGHEQLLIYISQMLIAGSIKTTKDFDKKHNVKAAVYLEENQALKSHKHKFVAKLIYKKNK